MPKQATKADNCGLVTWWGGGFVLREMLSGHYVPDVGCVVSIGVDFPQCDLDVEVPGCSFIPMFDHRCWELWWRSDGHGHGILVCRASLWHHGATQAMARGSAGGSFVMMAIAGWHRSVDISNSTTEINVFHSCAFVFAVMLLFLQLCYFFCSCTIFFAVVLISCMIPTYNFAVVPFILQLYNFFCSCTIFLQLYNFFCSCTIYSPTQWDFGQC